VLLEDVPKPTWSAPVTAPFRRYILWRKLTRAMLAIGREGTIAAAAHAADFADAEHLTRTFYQMFGTPLSVMMRGTSST
jgi:AraC-like DNA-binding protein